MTQRSIRRAAERKAKKQAAKTLQSPAPELPSALKPETPSPRHLQTLPDQLDWSPEPPDHAGNNDHACSPARLEANRRNSRLSTGPTSATGRAISSLNAVKTGLTGRTVLLTSDDAIAYQRHIQEYEQEFKPVALRERELVQSLADTQWRLQRIPGLEMAIYSQGRLEFEDSFDDHRPGLRPSRIELATFLKYEKQLRNLQLQESRLQRRYEKESAELRRLQKDRQAQDTLAEPCPPIVQGASPQQPIQQTDPQPYRATHPEVGFEFSNLPIHHAEARLHALEAA